MFEDLKAKVFSILDLVVNERGIEIIELKIHPRATMLSIDITADKIDGRITIDECAGLNKTLSRAIEEQNLIAGGWSVEVSSPGLDRELKTFNDFKRLPGARIRVHLSHDIGGKKEYEGVVEEVTEEKMVLASPKGQRIEIPFLALQVGKLLI